MVNHLLHQPVLTEDVLYHLRLGASSIVVDATFGRGGHTQAMLAQLGERGRVLAFDRDEQAISYGIQQICDQRLCLIHAPFSELESQLAQRQITQVDAIFFDLGVSSPQLDEAARGFSFRYCAPLDMRMDQRQMLDAAHFLATASWTEIVDVIYRYGEERRARAIATAIVRHRAVKPVHTTTDLARLVESCVAWTPGGIHPATRTFQAIRIHINQELQELTQVLPQVYRVLAVGGRCAVISFHSLEDRIVKHFLAQHAQPHHYVSRDCPLRACQLPQPRVVLVKPHLIRASEESCRHNVRARSARLRVAEKIRHESD